MTGDAVTQENLYLSPQMTPVSPTPESKGWLREVLAVIFILGVLTALLLPAVQSSRGSAPRTNCRNNLKQLGLAFFSYHAEYGSFPPAVVCDDDGRPMHSWRVLLLPYLDQQTLYSHYRFDEPWDGPNNISLQDAMPDLYRCPGDHRGDEASEIVRQHLHRLTNYVVVTSEDGLFSGSRMSGVTDIPDGHHHTLMTAEVRQHAVHWMSPDDVTPGELLTDLRLSANDDDDNCNHGPGINIGLADGSVRWIPHDFAEEFLRALVTTDQADPISADF